MSSFVDRRINGRHKSAENRHRFMQRYKEQIRRSVANAVSNRSIKDMDQGEKIRIPSKDLHEPKFGIGSGGQRHIIHTGNQDFIPGDKIQRPEQGQGGGSQASQDGEGEDDFAFELSREEFLDLFFADLALPNLIKEKLAKTEATKSVRAGFSTTGIPTHINVVRSLRQALGRRLAVGAPTKDKIEVAEDELLTLEKATPRDDEKIKALLEKISGLKHRLEIMPFLDPLDLRYNNRVKQPKPTTQAVMFCLMDVSGSMDEPKKEIAKRFFILLYLFLSKSYENVEVVFIRHHTSAKEVDEQEFFYSRETGGTVVSSALEMMRDIITSRYSPEDWNIYGAQASDGDNWNNDSPVCRDILNNDIMPNAQYFAYVEIMPRHHQSLWEAYLTLKGTHPFFAMQSIDDMKDIYPVFRELFKRKTMV